MSIKNYSWVDVDYRVAIKNLRVYFGGYDDIDGYSLRARNLVEKLTSYQKRKIKQQVRYISHLHSGVPKRIYRARSHKNIKSILEAQGVKNVPQNMRVAVIPHIEGEKTVAQYVKQRAVLAYDTKLKKEITLIELAPVKIITSGVTRRHVYINQDYLLSDPLAAILEMMKFVKADSYKIQAGDEEVRKLDEYKILAGDTPEIIASKIKKLILKYNQPSNNNFWKNWLGGFVAYFYEDQSDHDEFVVRRSLAHLRNADKRRKKRDRVEGRKERLRELNIAIRDWNKRLKRESNRGRIEIIRDFLDRDLRARERIYRAIRKDL